ncbi:MAG: VOC family protein [Cytophagales bacterium]|nr:VOC family protein [Cytophaga sp.]
MLGLKHVHHIAIICSNYERSKKFYIDVLGFTVVKETLRAERNSYKLDLSLNGHITLEIFSFINPPLRPSQPEAAGLRHLAFAVDNIEESIAYLTSHGVETEAIRIDTLTTKRFTFFADPDGLPLELYEE